MDIKITITSPDLHDAILALAEALGRINQESFAAFAKAHDAAIAAAPPAQSAPWTPDVNAASSAAAPVDNWVPPVQYVAVPPPAAQREPQTPPAQPPAAQPPMTAPQQPMTAPTKEYTLQEIAIWAVALQERDLPRLRQILEAFGVQALTQLPKEQYPAFVEALAAEGVTTHAR